MRIFVRATTILLLALPFIVGCRTTPMPFGEEQKSATFDFYLEELDEHSAHIDLHGPTIEQLTEVHRDDCLSARTPAEFNHALGRMFASIGDPHFEYSPAPFNSEFVSLGIRVVAIGNSWFVYSAPDHPHLLERTGKLPRIIAVDGVQVERSGVFLSSRLDGPPGSRCRFSLETGTGEIVEQELTYPVPEKLEMPSTIHIKEQTAKSDPWKKYVRVEREGDIGYLRIITFNRKELGLSLKQEEDPAEAVLLEALTQLEGCEFLILDLQSNGGGDFWIGLNLLGYFIEEKTIASTKVESRYFDLLELIASYVITKREPQMDATIAILVDEFTASTTEHVAVHLVRTKGAVLVGERTRGAQFMVSQLKGPDGSELTLGDSVYSFPEYISFQGEGIDPDTVIPVPIHVARELGYKVTVDLIRKERLEAAFKALGLDTENIPSWTDRAIVFK